MTSRRWNLDVSAANHRAYQKSKEYVYCMSQMQAKLCLYHDELLLPCFHLSHEFKRNSFLAWLCSSLACCVYPLQSVVKLYLSLCFARLVRDEPSLAVHWPRPYSLKLCAPLSLKSVSWARSLRAGMCHLHLPVLTHIICSTHPCVHVINICWDLLHSYPCFRWWG